MPEQLHVVTRAVYQKDLYEEYYSVPVRLPAGDVEHGDLLRVTIERIRPADREDMLSTLREADAEEAVSDDGGDEEDASED